MRKSNSNLSLVLFIILLFSLPSIVFSQGEHAVPFLLIPASPEANGIAGISGSMITNDAMASITNPGQLGLQSLTSYVNTGFYTQKTDWLTGFAGIDITYEASAYSIGLNLNKLMSLPFGFSIGAGISTVDLSLNSGWVPSSSSGINYEKSEMTSLSFGFDYIAQFGLGISRKRITSALSPLEQNSPAPHAYATDIGMIARIPLHTIISRIRDREIAIGKVLKPTLDMQLSYARLNDGGDIYYLPEYPENNPLPLRALIGINWKIGLQYGEKNPTELISIIHAREADDILLRRTAGNIEYENGFGDLKFFDQLILGSWGGNVALRKGWQLNILQFFEYRRGHTVMPGLEFEAEGFTLDSRGIPAIIDLLKPDLAMNCYLEYILRHVEVRYSWSKYIPSDYGHPFGLTTFSGLNIRLVN